MSCVPGTQTAAVPHSVGMVGCLLAWACGWLRATAAQHQAGSSNAHTAQGRALCGLGRPAAAQGGYTHAQHELTGLHISQLSTKPDEASCPVEVCCAGAQSCAADSNETTNQPSKTTNQPGRMESRML